jgi:hypothetical protein
MNESPRFQFRTRALLIATTAVAILIAVVLNWPFVSSERVLSVEPGMSEAEVVQLMGGQYNEGPHDRSEGYYWVWRRWPLHVAVVRFSPDGHVTEAFND